MPIKRLQNMLDAQGVRYVTLRHSPAFTAQEVAASSHISGHNLAKTVVVMLDDEMAMVVLPASMRVNFDLLSEMTGHDDVRLASEAAFASRFPGCELGAIPPFGNLYQMQVYMSPLLTGHYWITFCAGTHTELIRMAWVDYERIAQPELVSLAA